MELTNSYKLSPALFLWALCHIILIQHSRGQTGNQQACETTNVNGTTEYQLCQASSESLYNLNITPSVVPEDYTCGYSQDIMQRVYCTLVG